MPKFWYVVYSFSFILEYFLLYVTSRLSCYFQNSLSFESLNMMSRYGSLLNLSYLELVALLRCVDCYFS